MVLSPLTLDANSQLQDIKVCDSQRLLSRALALHHLVNLHLAVRQPGSRRQC